MAPKTQIDLFQDDAYDAVMGHMMLIEEEDEKKEDEEEKEDKEE